MNSKKKEEKIVEINAIKNILYYSMEKQHMIIVFLCIDNQRNNFYSW